MLRPGGVLYLSTAPYLSLAGAHLPRLLVPVPLHILVGRPRRLRALPLPGPPRALAAAGAEGGQHLHRPRRAGPARSRTTCCRRSPCSRLAAWIRGAGFRLLREDRYVTGFFRRALPGPCAAPAGDDALGRDVMIGHIQCVLEKP